MAYMNVFVSLFMSSVNMLHIYYMLCHGPVEKNFVQKNVSPSHNSSSLAEIKCLAQWHIIRNDDCPGECPTAFTVFKDLKEDCVIHYLQLKCFVYVSVCTKTVKI